MSETSYGKYTKVNTLYVCPRCSPCPLLQRFPKIDREAQVRIAACFSPCLGEAVRLSSRRASDFDFISERVNILMPDVMASVKIVVEIRHAP